MSSTRYYQVLNALIDNPGALEHDPMLIKRLRRLRASRQRARSARRLGDGALSHAAYKHQRRPSVREAGRALLCLGWPDE
jgi:hypothetical protein